MKCRIDMLETVWNSYEMTGIPDNFERVLKEIYSGNPYAMLKDYPEMHIELTEPCFDFVDTDYNKTEINC